MKKTLSLLIPLLAAAALVSAGEHEKSKHRIKVVLDTGSEPIDVEAQDLAVGESREFQTESGKPVVLTRTEDGLEVTVDGKKIDVLGKGGDYAFFHGGERTKVFVAHAGEGEEGEHRFLWVDDDAHGEAHGEAHGGNHRVVKIHRHHRDTAEQLQASGVLDELDAATRDRILAELHKIDAGPHVEIDESP